MIGLTRTKTTDEKDKFFARFTETGDHVRQNGHLSTSWPNYSLIERVPLKHMPSCGPCSPSLLEIIELD